MKKVSLFIVALAVAGSGSLLEARGLKSQAQKTYKQAKTDIKRHATDVRAAWQAGRQAQKGKGFQTGWQKYKEMQQPRALTRRPITPREKFAAQEQMRKAEQAAQKQAGRLQRWGEKKGGQLQQWAEGYEY